MKYPQKKDGERVSPKMAPHSYKMMCCDCGLVHRLKFFVARLTKRRKGGYWEGETVSGYKVIFQAWRDQRATALTRRQRKRRF